MFPPEAERLADYWHILRHQGPFNNVVTLLVCHYTIYKHTEPTTSCDTQSQTSFSGTTSLRVLICQHFEIFLEVTLLQIKIVIMILQIPERTTFLESPYKNHFCYMVLRRWKNCFWCYNIRSDHQYKRRNVKNFLALTGIFFFSFSV